MYIYICIYIYRYVYIYICATTLYTRGFFLEVLSSLLREELQKLRGSQLDAAPGFLRLHRSICNLRAGAGLREAMNLRIFSTRTSVVGTKKASTLRWKGCKDGFVFSSNLSLNPLVVSCSLFFPCCLAVPKTSRIFRHKPHQLPSCRLSKVEAPE